MANDVRGGGLRGLPEQNTEGEAIDFLLPAREERCCLELQRPFCGHEASRSGWEACVLRMAEGREGG